MTSTSLTACAQQIIFYEDRNFGGRRYECMSDCADLHSMFNRCQSIRVESGMFVIYDHPGFNGNQYFIRRGDYADYMTMMNMSDCVRSCRMIPLHCGNFRMRLFNHVDMEGQMMELMDDCPNLMERFCTFDFNSCNVIDGHWLMYEQPNYRGRHYYLRTGEYRKHSEWGAETPRIGSIRRIMDL
ncbi:gamma-crystallin 1-like [Lampris incognitus]|uniref:gamma-crystallin 1-like n=1 Tax=Lampris incognitus TaxID=2546036 RepID=UPI0024B5BB53|nr:gamma-crystallin 1-like [Lampris incognitus]